MQLAELRNTLRHSRALSDVVVKDGEAAILWFGAALRRASQPSGEITRAWLFQEWEVAGNSRFSGCGARVLGA
jgi:hypothetical protein